MRSDWKISIVFFLSLVCLPAFGQKNLKEAYIKKYHKIAIQEMKKYGIPASITLAQGILESGAGQSTLAKKSNNHFGIKCHNDWRGKKVYHDDDKKGECFRKYKHPEESYRDHSIFLAERQRYRFLFDYKITDYKRWAKGLKKAGYATSRTYATKLIALIEEYRLYRFDKKKYQPEEELILAVTEIPVGSTIENNSLPVDIDPSAMVHVSSNFVKFVYAKDGDRYEHIAKRFGVWVWEVMRYNEVDEDRRLKEGEIVYLQPKRRKSWQGFHTVKNGETMYEISQKFGIKLKHLYRRNCMDPGTEAIPGTKLFLKKKKKC